MNALKMIRADLAETARQMADYIKRHPQHKDTCEVELVAMNEEIAELDKQIATIRAAS